ncbi:MAG: hypothetical protein AAGH67_07475 [Cyanobacteria bacterium P01_H01_bin.162]
MSRGFLTHLPHCEMSAITLRPIETSDRFTLTRSEINLPAPPNASGLMAILAVCKSSPLSLGYLVFSQVMSRLKIEKRYYLADR